MVSIFRLDVIQENKKNKKQTKHSDSREFTPFYTSPPPINPSIFSFRDGWVHQGWCLWHCQWNRVRHQHGVQIALIPKTGSMNTFNQVRFVLGWVYGRCCFGAKNWKGTKLERDGEPGTRKLKVRHQETEPVHRLLKTFIKLDCLLTAIQQKKIILI